MEGTPRPAPRAVVAVVCGFPGAGKSTLCARAGEAVAGCVVGSGGGRVVAHHVSLDAVEREVRGGDGGGGFEREAWRVSRGVALERVDALLRESALLEGGSGEEGVGSGERCLVLVDDTMHLRSMRHAYWRLARDRGAGFVVVHVDESVDVARARNADRDASTRVPEDAFARIVDAFEVPGAEPWEAGDALVRVGRCGSSMEDSSVWPRLCLAMARRAPDPREPPEVAEERRAKGEAANAASAVHAADTLARKLVGAAVSLAPADVRSQVAAELNAMRRDALDAVRRGVDVDDALGKLRRAAKGSQQG